MLTVTLNIIQCEGFPTMILFIDGVPIANYMGTRTNVFLKEFVLQMLTEYHPNDHYRYELKYDE